MPLEKKFGIGCRDLGLHVLVLPMSKVKQRSERAFPRKLQVKFQDTKSKQKQKVLVIIENYAKVWKTRLNGIIVLD